MNHEKVLATTVFSRNLKSYCLAAQAKYIFNLPIFSQAVHDFSML